MTGRPVEILMFDDRLEIISPGQFPGTVSPETIRDDHFARNPRIARVLAEMEYIRDIGEGVDRMYQEIEAAGLPEPEWIEEPGAVRLILRNAIEVRGTRVATPEERLARKLAELNERQRRAIEHIKIAGRITRREYATLMAVSRITAARDLSDLVKRGVLLQRGMGRSTYYVLHE